MSRNPKRHIELLVRLVDSTLESCDNRPLERSLAKAREWLLAQLSAPTKTSIEPEPCASPGETYCECDK